MVSASLHSLLLEAGCALGGLDTDLYVEDTEAARAIIKEHGRPFGMWSFTSSDTGKSWIGLPACRDPDLPIRR